VALSIATPEINDAQPWADHAHLSTFIDDSHHHTSRTSRSLSAASKAVPVAEYQKWPFQGFLKCTGIGNKTMYNLEFQLLHIPEHHLTVISEALGIRSNKEMSAEATTPYDAGAHCQIHSAAVRPQIKRVRWTPEEDATMLQDEGGGWLLVGRDPSCPPSPEHRDDPGALFDEVEKLVLLNVTALITQYPTAIHRQRYYIVLICLS
jgi:hypothetical protein